MLTKHDISQALNRLGIVPGDLVLVHSSLRSLGPLEYGAQSVVDGFLDTIGPEGTLVMPTLCQKDFLNSYNTWHMDKPSDVGYLTEYFRKMPGVLRSDHATHSIAAYGKHAHMLTCEHGAYGPHLCPFGEYAFADSSPWLKMYAMGTKTVFIGVSTRYNTMKHTVEARYAEFVLSQVKDPACREALRREVATFGHFTGVEVWPMYSGDRMHEEYERLGLLQSTQCGNATVLCIDMKQGCDTAYELLSAQPESWCNAATMDWLHRCREAFE